MPPLVLRIAALLVGLFGLAQLFTGGIALRQRNWPIAALYLALGLGGLALAQALWRTVRRPRP